MITCTSMNIFANLRPVPGLIRLVKCIALGSVSPFRSHACFRSVDQTGRLDPRSSAVFSNFAGQLNRMCFMKFNCSRRINYLFVMIHLILGCSLNVRGQHGDFQRGRVTLKARPVFGNLRYNGMSYTSIIVSCLHLRRPLRASNQSVFRMAEELTLKGITWDQISSTRVHKTHESDWFIHVVVKVGTGMHATAGQPMFMSITWNIQRRGS